MLFFLLLLLKLFLLLLFLSLITLYVAMRLLLIEVELGWWGGVVVVVGLQSHNHVNSVKLS